MRFICCRTLTSAAIVSVVIGFAPLVRIGAAQPLGGISAPNLSLGYTTAASTESLARAAGHFAIAAPAPLPKHARELGPLPRTRRLQLAFALAPSNPVGLANVAREISTPGTPVYHRFLSPIEVASRFGPTPSTIARVSHEISLLGLRVGGLSSNHLMLHVSASVATLSSSLRAHLVSVRLGDGTLGWRLTSKAFFPAEFSGDISAVVGLNNVAFAHSMIDVHAGSSVNLGSSATGLSRLNPAACTSATLATRYSGGWTESQIASAYGLSPLYGANDVAMGQTIAVVELEPFLKSDIATFDRCYFGESHVNLVHRVPIDGFNYRGAGTGESVLDIESLSALAPAATIDVYEAPNTTIGTLDTYNAIVSADSANLITTSWGECEQLLDSTSPGARQVENFIFEEAAAQGQTVIAATGDSGSDDCATTPFGSDSPVAPYLSVDDPASQPYVLGVGGTSLRNDVQPLSGSSEIAWNDGSQGGAGGGGVSENWASPSWQTGSGVPGTSALSGRQVPDVSASSDSVLGMTVYSASFGKNGWTTIGGTSAAAPIWAAVLAEIAGSGPAGTACTALGVTPGGADLGFVPPLLYAAAAGAYATNFHVISVGNNDAFRLGLGYRASPGYNMVGGLGSPIVTNPDGRPGLASALCVQATQAPSVAVARPIPLSIAPGYGPVGGGTTVEISLAQQLAPGATITATFDGVPAQVISTSGTSISVVTPAASTTPLAASLSSAGPAAVSVTQTTATGSATSIASPGLVFEYVNESGAAVVPSVSGVTPSAGNLVGGDVISIYGSGFSVGRPSVTIGGQPATSVKVVSDYLLVATTPPETGSTSCATGSGFDATTVCQTQVVVANANGASSPATILPVLTGSVSYTPLGVIAANGSVEVAPGATEYDYAPTPSISAIRPNPASPKGRTIVRIIGRGFSLNTLDWVNFGPPDRVDSQQVKLRFISGNEIDLEAPAAHRLAGKALEYGVSVQSAAGLSKPKGFSYLGVPSVRSLASSAGPVRGGGFITVIGNDFLGVTTVRFVDVLHPNISMRVSGRSLRDVRRSSLIVRVPPGRSGPFVIEPCNPVWCAPFDASSATYVYLGRAAPSLTHVAYSTVIGTQSSMVVLFGADLAGATEVSIGTYRATRFVPSGTIPLGDPNVAIVLVPSGVALRGQSVSIETPVGRSAPGITLQ